jgi:hypothetical protein
MTVFEANRLTCEARGRYGAGPPCGQPAAYLTPRGWMCTGHAHWRPLPTDVARECWRSIQEAKVAHWRQTHGQTGA